MLARQRVMRGALGSHCVTRAYLTLNQADPEKQAACLGGVRWARVDMFSTFGSPVVRVALGSDPLGAEPREFQDYNFLVEVLLCIK